MLLIGVDCATDPRNTGLALATYESGQTHLKEVVLGSAQDPPSSVLGRWLTQDEEALLAIDAPLGWPLAMGSVLASHRAGQPISAEPNMFFRRETDRFVQSRLRKTPLDVGADRIARTARAALALLETVRSERGLSIPLAWDPSSNGVSAIEVYPAATLLAHGFRSSEYKKADQLVQRKEILDSLTAEIRIEAGFSLLQESPDALDSVICVLAAQDFLQGRVYSPDNLDAAQREGWIWFGPRRLKS